MTTRVEVDTIRNNRGFSDVGRFGIDDRPGWVSPSIVIWFILVLLVFGFIFGMLGRLLVPGKDPMSLLQTWLVGVAGSLLGGFLGAVLFGFDEEDGALQAGGLIGSIIGAVIIVLIVRLARRNA